MPHDDSYTSVGPAASISNEFAHVRVKKVETRAGERLEIEAPRLGSTIYLDAVELEALTLVSKAQLSSFLNPGDRFDRLSQGE